MVVGGLLLVVVAIPLGLFGKSSSSPELGSSQQKSEPTSGCARRLTSWWGGTDRQQQGSSEVSNGKIAFQRRTSSGAGDIYVIDEDGTNETRLTANPSADWDAAWSPNGEKIAFVSTRQGQQDIYVMDADGTNEARLVNSSAKRDGPVWSPDGETIAFRAWNSGESDIKLTNKEGTNEVVLTPAHTATTEIYSYPTWSPEGTKIAFSRYVADRQRKTYPDPGEASPAPLTVFSTTGVEERTGVYMIDVDGNGLCKLASTDLEGRGGDAHFWSPAWSPDGNKIAFYDYDVFNVINADGTGRKELTKTARAEPPERDAGLAQHVWSPDSNKIAFIKDYDLYVINANGTGQRRLTNTELLEDFPTWSPDGKKIAITSERYGSSRGTLYVINADGSDLTRLATDVGDTVSWGSE